MVVTEALALKAIEGCFAVTVKDDAEREALLKNVFMAMFYIEKMYLQQEPAQDVQSEPEA